MQVVRLILILITVGVWGANFYINVRKCVMYLNFWALTFTLLYLLCVFPSAGRQVVESKLKAKNSFKDEVESDSWKRAVVLHSIAWPVSVTSAVLFSAFLFEDQICATYFDFGFEQWRGVVVFIASYTPILVLFIDFVMNKLVISYKHLITNVVLLGFYFLGTFFGSLIQGRPIYANHLAYKSNYTNNYASINDKDLTDWGIAKRNYCLGYFNWEGSGDNFTMKSGW